MDATMMNELRIAVEPIARLVEKGDFTALAQFADPRVRGEHLAAAVRDYGAAVVPLTESEFAKARIVELSPEVAASTWAVWLPLRTEEEGTSDLKLQLVVHRAANGEYDVKVDGIQVP